MAVAFAVQTAPASAQGTNTISGTVTQEGGGALENVCVNLNPDGPGTFGSDQTAASGEYSFTGVNDGSYRLYFQPCPNGPNVVAEYYENKPDFQSATIFSVSGGETRVIDADLATGATISGTVTDQTTTNGVANICVAAQSTGPGISQASVPTNGSGEYTITGLRAGSYKIFFSPCFGDGSYVTEYWNDKRNFQDANTVTLAAGETRDDVHAALQPGASIGGVVTNSGGQTVGNVCVFAQSAPGGGGFHQAVTNGQGEYRLRGLPPDSYRIQFSACGGPSAPNVVTEYWNDKPDLNSADPVSVTVGQQRNDISPVLDIGVTVRGTVVSDETSQPLPNVCVRVQPSNLPANGTIGTAATTNGSGEYTVSGLRPGSYRVMFTPCMPQQQNLVTEFWDDKATGEAANVFTLAAGEEQVANAGLARGATISGTVTAEQGGANLQGICVWAEAPGGGPQQPAIASAITNSSGQYTLGGLRAGSYAVRFFTCNQFPGNPQHNVLPEYWNNKPDAASADPVTLTAGEDRGAVNAALAPGARISGTVTLQGAANSNGLCAQSWQRVNGSFQSRGFTSVQSNGAYTLQGLAAGEYFVQFGPCFGSVDAVPEYWDNATDPADADPIVLAAGEHRTPIDAVLAPGGRIAGTITAPGSLAGVCATAFPASYGSMQEFGGASAGFSTPLSSNTSPATYEIRGLPTGNFKVRFQPCAVGAENYAREFYSDKRSLGTADSIAVTAGATTPNIDVDLERGGTISGTLTNASGPLMGICVGAFDPSTKDIRGGALSGSNGAYTIPNLIPGDYKLKFFTGTCRFAGSTPVRTEFFDDALSFGDADAVTVTQGATANASAVLAAPSAPETTITSGPAGTTKATTASFSFASDQPEDARFECKLDRPGAVGNFEPCNAGKRTYSTADAGDYRFEVRAQEPAANLVDQTPAVREWTVDLSSESETTEGTVEEGGTVTSDPAGEGVSPSNPVTTEIETPVGGTVSITETSEPTVPAPSGYTLFGQEVQITADPATDPSEPLRFTFRVDASAMDDLDPAPQIDDVGILRNGEPADLCLGAGTIEADWPCITHREFLTGGDDEGDLVITVLTMAASGWSTVVKADRCTVPDVVGDERGAAEAEIEAAGCTVGEVAVEKDKNVKLKKPMVVVSQSPPGGQTVPAGTEIDLVVSQKKPK
jgi:hypothetical protein